MVDSQNRLVTVVLVVSDLDRAVALYRGGFGLDLHLGDHQGDDPWTSGRHAATSWSDGAFMHFALYASKGGQSTTGRPRIGHFAVADLEAAHATRWTTGAELVHGPRSQPWGRSARYRDFDGNVIELTQPA